MTGHFPVGVEVVLEMGILLVVTSLHGMGHGKDLETGEENQGKGEHFQKFVVVLCGTQATEKWLLTTSRLPVSSFPRLNVPTYSTVSVPALYRLRGSPGHSTKNTILSPQVRFVGEDCEQVQF